MKAAIYRDDGSIRGIYNGPSNMIEMQLGAEESWIEGDVDDSTHYVHIDAETTLMPKQDYTLETLPLPCAIIVEGVEYFCTEQPTFNFTPAGDYEISVDAGVKYLKKKFIYTQV